MPKRKHQLEIAVWRAPDLGGELLRGRFSDFSYEVHTHDTACFALLTRGAIRIRTRGQEFTARKGDLYAIEADEPHAGCPIDERGWNLRTLYVDTNYLRSLVGESGRRRALDIKGPIIRDPAMAAMLYAVHRCSQIEGPQLKRQELYMAFAARLLERHVSSARCHSSTAPEHRAIRVAREFIDHSIDRNISLTEIADAAGLPAHRLFRSFEKSTGMTPHAYQRQARVRLAKNLIRAHTPLGEIAAATGFSDQAHLTRWFRRMMGVTPGIYQKAMQT